MEKNEVIAVKYYGGEYDNCNYVRTLFITQDEQTAIEYVNKFNSILQKWKDYLTQFEEDGWIKKEFETKWFRRWIQIRDISKCCYTKIEIR